MKRNMIIASALAVAGIATYFIRRRMTSTTTNETSMQPSPRSNHRTNAFSRAKQHAMSV